MDSKIETLRRELAGYYAGEKNPRDREALAGLWERANQALCVVQKNSFERRWLDGLFRTLNEWGYKKEWSSEPTKVRPIATERMTFRDGMPAAIPCFFGRENEKGVLSEWLDKAQSRVFQVIAAGGYGKTQLVNYWMEQVDQTRPFDAVFCWCFYTTQGRLPNFSAFFTDAIQFFEQVRGKRKAVLPKDRAIYLAELVASGNHLVVLDGLEALQRKPKSNDNDDIDVEPGEFRKRFRDMEVFLHSFSRHALGKIIITTRQSVKTLIGAVSGTEIITLKGLDVSDGVAILRRSGVHGTDETLAKIVADYAGHPLSLSLMAFALAWHYDGAASQYQHVQLTEHGRVKATEALDDNDVIPSYVRWLKESPETELLQLVGFFHQRQIPLEDIRVLLSCEEIRPVVPTLWKRIAVDGHALDWQALYETLWTLQDSMLLLGDLMSVRKGDRESSKPTFVYDAHPLLRDYFAKEIQNRENGRYWRAGQAILYKACLTKVGEIAMSREDTLVLYDAIGYACQAEMYREAFETYWHRVHHNDLTYAHPNWHAWYQLGLYSADLGALGWFYANQWEQLHAKVDIDLNSDQKTMLRLATAECLKTLGLAREAGHPIDSVRKALKNDEDGLAQMAIVLGWECERRLIQGEFDKARIAARRALGYAKRSADPRQILSKHGRLGDLFMQKGNWEKADIHFSQVLKQHRKLIGAQKLQKVPIAGFTGFLYGDFLLTRAEIVLANWDPDGKYLSRKFAPTRNQACSELDSVIAEASHVEQMEKVSLYDRVLHRFLQLRAMAIRNVSVTGMHGKPDPELHRKVNDGLRQLEQEFDQYAHGELPRLLVKRSKVLRRLREMGISQTSADGDLVAAAFRCLDRAADIAAYGKMALFEADVYLERTKVFICYSDFPDSSTDAKTLLENAAACFAKAEKSIRNLVYRKRLPELKSVGRQLKAKHL